MQKISELLIQNIKNLPIWVKQVITKEIVEDLRVKYEEFSQLIQTDSLFQTFCPVAFFSLQILLLKCTI